MQHGIVRLNPWLVIGIGNPSRGDDALGPMLVSHLETQGLTGVELLTDFQLQVEYALDLQDRETVIFVDAAMAGPEPFSFSPTGPAEDTSYSSHALSPSALLHAYEKLFGVPPQAYTLAIRGYQFDLGTPLSDLASANLEAATQFISSQLPGSVNSGPVKAGA